MDTPHHDDPDPIETLEWLDALNGVIENEGPDRAHYLIEKLIARARRNGAYLPFSANTAYINTIPTDHQVRRQVCANLWYMQLDKPSVGTIDSK